VYIASRVAALTTYTEFIAAYNLLIHLVGQSSNINNYLQTICRNLSGEINASQNNKFGIALSVLSTVFNILPADDSVRYPVFNTVLDVVSRSASYESLRPYLGHLENWLTQWSATPLQSRKLYLRIAAIGRDAGEEEEAYKYHVMALRTIPAEDVSGEEARKLSVDALKTAFNSASHFDFEDLTSLDAVQALRNSDPIYFQLLEILTADLLEDFRDFEEEHQGWVEDEGLDEPTLTRKMRLLTIASLAASSGQSRSIPYSAIAKALQVPSEDVEMWVIDVIRAGLVEGKLSQLNQTFLIHRSTYRVFRENQWREIAGRLDMWRTSLMGVLAVVRQEKESMIAQKEQELRQVEAKINGNIGGGYRRPAQRDTIDVGMD